MRMFARIALLACTAPLLASCALLGIGGRHEPQIEAMSTLPDDAEAYVQFELARMSLSSGNYARAIGEFSNARAEPALLGPALNGMAVAYARLGRNDLAERYFREAMAAEPGDTRYAANLLRLQRAAAQDRGSRVELALGEVDVPPPVVVTANSVPRIRVIGGTASRGDTVEPQARIARIDAQQVHLTTVVSEPPRNGAQVRLRFEQSGTVAENDSYPVRVSLSQTENTRVRVTTGGIARRGGSMFR